MLTLPEARQAADGIRILVQSERFATAHCYEDEFLKDVIRAIAGGADNPIPLAKEAMKVIGLRYPRRCG